MNCLKIIPQFKPKLRNAGRVLRRRESVMEQPLLLRSLIGAYLSADYTSANF